MEIELRKKVKLDLDTFLHLSQSLKHRDITFEAFYIYVLIAFLSDDEGGFNQDDLERACKVLIG